MPYGHERPYENSMRNNSKGRTGWSGGKVIWHAFCYHYIDMAEETPKFDPKLEEGIAYFEKMMQVMPEDRTTLEFLCVAYGQVNEPQKQRKALISLANVLLKENDLESADRIAERLAQYREPAAQAMVLRIRAAHGPHAEPTSLQTSVPVGMDEPSSRQGNTHTTAVHTAVRAEKELLQLLVARKVIDETVSEDVQRRLLELADTPSCLLVSALAIIEKDSTGTGELAVSVVADESGAPPVPLEIFNISEELLQSIPESIARVRGVLPFSKLGDTLLVATLNPLDAALKHQVEASVGCPCKFYTAHPRTMEELLDRLFAEPQAEGPEQQEAS